MNLCKKYCDLLIAHLQSLFFFFYNQINDKNYEL